MQGPFGGCTSGSGDLNPGCGQNVQLVETTVDVGDLSSSSRASVELTVDLRLWAADTWNRDEISVYVDGNVVPQLTRNPRPAATLRGGCPSIFVESCNGWLQNRDPFKEGWKVDSNTYNSINGIDPLYLDVTFKVKTTSRYLKIGVGCSLDQIWQNEYWGFSNLKVTRQIKDTARSNGCPGNDCGSSCLTWYDFTIFTPLIL